MSQDIIDRLRRLGVTKGARNLKPASKPPPSRVNRRYDGELPNDISLERQIAGGRVEGSNTGGCYIVDKVYPLSYIHGDTRLSALLGQDPSAAAAYSKDSRLSGLDFRDFVFLDTETTGLHGAGTIAFLVGIAFFDKGAQEDVLVVRQYFLRDHDDEAAMLQFLNDFLADKRGLITFNGATFDLTLLENRYLMNRIPDNLRRMPHIDLLPPARRLWRNRIGSVALSNLEKELLAVRRTEEDVPGWLIPSIYNDYLRSQDARELVRIFYHNQIDMLSMVTLADYLLRHLTATSDEIHPLDLYSLGNWQADIGLQQEAEQTLHRAVQSNLPLPVYHQALARLALIMKRQQRYNEALPLWQQWAATSMDEVDAFEELAKYYEWREKDLILAEEWTLKAIKLVDSWPPSRASVVRPRLVHRLARLRRKLSG